MPWLLRLDVWLARIGIGICLLLLISAPFASGGSGCLGALLLGLIGAIFFPTYWIAQFVSLRKIPPRQRVVVAWRALTRRMKIVSIVAPLVGFGLVGLAEVFSEEDALSEAGWQNHVAVAGLGIFLFAVFGSHAYALLAAPEADAARRCPNGHPAPLAADHCPTCGVRVEPRGGRGWEILHTELSMVSHDRMTRLLEWLSLVGAFSTAVGLSIRFAGPAIDLVSLWIGVAVLFALTFVLSLIVTGRMQSELSQWELLKLLWRAAPKWLWLAQAALALVFLLQWSFGPIPIGGPTEAEADLPLLALVGFCGLYFFGRGFRAIAEPKLVRRCENGHLVGAGDSYCPDCGAALGVRRRT